MRSPMGPGMSRSRILDIVKDLFATKDEVKDAVGGVQTTANKCVTSISASGTKVTYTKADGTTGSFTTQDNNTWRGCIDNLSSTSATDSLSAKQGKVLNDGKKDKSNFSFNSSSATLSISV